MSDTLFGYNMLLQITQNEINSQFERLTTAGYIDPLLKTNALSAAGGAFGGGVLSLSSYLRGYIGAPTVALALADDPLSCLFEFIPQLHPLTPADIQAAGITQQQLDAAFTHPQAGPNNSQYGLLVKQEAIAYISNGEPANLPDQTVYYWLQRTALTIGTITSFSYSMVPALFYVSGGNSTLVDLTGLPIQFVVKLDAIATTPDAIASLVSQGLMPQQVLDTITGNSFNSQYFSLQQLFLNFDTTDFTQWSTTAPPTSTLVSGASVNTANQTFSIATLPLSQLEQDPGFLTEVSVALQYAFGVGATYNNNPAQTPYIVGVSARSTNPAQSHPGCQPLLVPTAVGFSSIANTSIAGLSVLNYQVMSGGQNNPTQPAPNVSTCFVTSNDYSGEMLFSQASFFTPEIYNPLVLALTAEHAPTPVWHQNGNTFTYQTRYDWLVSSTPAPSNFFKTGTSQTLIQTESPDYTIEVAGSNVTVAGELQITQTLHATLTVLSVEVNLSWSVTCSSRFNQVLTMTVVDHYRLNISRTSNTFSEPTNGPLVPNDWKAGLGYALIEAVDAVIYTFFPVPSLKNRLNPIDYMTNTVHTSIDQSLDRLRTQLNQNLTQSASANFISPTGEVFFLNAPRFNDTLDLQMDVTYSV